MISFFLAALAFLALLLCATAYLLSRDSDDCTSAQPPADANAYLPQQFALVAQMRGVNN